MFPFPIDPLDHANNQSASDNTAQGRCVGDTLELPVESPVTEQSNVPVDAGESSATPPATASDVRRSVRGGRGTTSKYDNFIRD